MEQVIQIMNKYGFSEMETKVYTTLLEKGTLTGYEVSKQSGVARSKVYNILEKLVQKNLIVINKSEPKLYHAISSNEFLARLEKNVQEDLAFLTSNLGLIKEEAEEEMLWKLDNYQHMTEKASYVIKKAQHSLLIQLWQEDLNEEFIALLQAAEKRLEQFVVILFSKKHDYQLPLEKYYIHGFESEKLADFGSRWINIVADETEVVFGTIDENNRQVDITWTKNNAMVSLAKEYIKHDAYTLKIIREMPECLEERYGKEFKNIRLIY